MKQVIVKLEILEVHIPILENILTSHGFINFNIVPEECKYAKLIFTTEEESFLFKLKYVTKDLQKQIDRICIFEPDIDLVEKLEKKLDAYNKTDEYELRKIMREKQ